MLHPPLTPVERQKGEFFVKGRRAKTILKTDKFYIRNSFSGVKY